MQKSSNAPEKRQKVSQAELFAKFRHKKIDLYGQAAHEVDFPTRPQSLEELDISFALIVKLFLKHLLVGGSMRNDELAGKMAIPVSLLEEPTRFLRNEALIEGRGKGAAGVSGIMELSLTDRGREHARNYQEESTYSGPVPVTIQQYREQIRKQTVRDQIASREEVDGVFANIVVKKETLTQIGAAFNSGGSLFMYGPAGTGKTFLANHMLRLLQGDIAIPHAVVVEGQIIRVFDPVNHTAVGEDETTQAVSQQELRKPNKQTMDARWVRCKRPVIIAGSELTLDMVDLKYTPAIGFYEAPLQMKANGGIFLIDDLGRQIVQPKTLLNRWIVPLENEVDYLGLHTGTKFQIPFDIIPIFATNLSPEKLADEAFLRRLGYKIHVDYLSEQEFHTVFEQYCMANDLDYDAGLVDYLINEHYKPANRSLAACQPRDLINKVIDFSLFDGNKPKLTKELLAQAWQTYFVSE
ncbi:MAG: AAA family ATPase [Granulosicoccaceae bacterium]